MNSSDLKSGKNGRGIIFTDFDGTLFNSERFIAEKNFAALDSARSRGYITAIATGRSLFSFRRVVESIEKPIHKYFDYLIFSSGAGIIRSFEGITGFGTPVTPGDIIEAEELSAADAAEAAGLLYRHGIDFMIQRSVPENHRFTYIKSNSAINPDFYRRMKIYSDFADALEAGDGDDDAERIEKNCSRGVSQLVAIIPPSANHDDRRYSAEMVEYLRQKLPNCTVVRTTSPIDGRSLWIEIFHPEVSKSKAAARITERLGIPPESTLAIGNDFNDEDLLDWAAHSRTVDEAPEELRLKFRAAGRSADGAVASAIFDFIS